MAVTKTASLTACPRFLQKTYSAEKPTAQQKMIVAKVTQPK
jgi:hypothetical protein